MSADLLEASVFSSRDGESIVLMLRNHFGMTVSIREPHPHTNIRFLDNAGIPLASSRGAFFPMHRWELTLQPSQGCERNVTIPDWYLNAQGNYKAIVRIPFRVIDGEWSECLASGNVLLNLPSRQQYNAR